jgi:predicted Zn-dependent protease with MMP-like domain
MVSGTIMVKEPAPARHSETNAPGDTARLAAGADRSAAEWQRDTAPTMEEIEALAQTAFEALPEQVRAVCEGVVFRIEEFASREDLRAVGARSRYELLGLFAGEGIAQREAGSYTGQFPNMIYLYRQPILAFWFEREDTLGAIVNHVLVHEIGHHFGLSDEDMQRIDDGPD